MITLTASAGVRGADVSLATASSGTLRIPAPGADEKGNGTVDWVNVAYFIAGAFVGANVAALALALLRHARETAPATPAIVQKQDESRIEA